MLRNSHRGHRPPPPPPSLRSRYPTHSATTTTKLTKVAMGVGAAALLAASSLAASSLTALSDIADVSLEALTAQPTESGSLLDNRHFSWPTVAPLVAPLKKSKLPLLVKRTNSATHSHGFSGPVIGGNGNNMALMASPAEATTVNYAAPRPSPLASQHKQIHQNSSPLTSNHLSFTQSSPPTNSAAGARFAASSAAATAIVSAALTATRSLPSAAPAPAPAPAPPTRASPHRLEHAKAWLRWMGLTGVVPPPLPPSYHANSKGLSIFFRDGLLLCSIVGKMTGVVVEGVVLRPRARAQCIANIEKGLQVRGGGGVANQGSEPG